MHKIEVGDAEHNFINKNFEIEISLIDKEKRNIVSKKIVITKNVWFFEFPKYFKMEYRKENIRIIHDKIKKWLEDFANKLKSEYSEKWEEQPNVRVVKSDEII